LFRQKDQELSKDLILLAFFSQSIAKSTDAKGSLANLKLILKKNFSSS
jgi:hypothetical protein